MDFGLIIAPHAIIDNKRIISPAIIEVRDGIITGISQTIPKKTTGKTVRLDDVCLMPGFTNAHCHLELTSLGPLEAHQFVPWLQEIVLAKTEQTLSDKIDGIKNGIEKLTRSGVTTIVDHVSFDTPVSAFANAPTRIISFGEVLGLLPEKGQHTYEALKNSKTAATHDFHISPHAIYSVTAALLQQVFNEESSPYSIHLAENAEERLYLNHQDSLFWDFVLQSYPELTNRRHDQARSSVSYLQNHNISLHDSLLIHANDVDDQDMTVMQSWQNICVVHCPGSFDFFGHPHFPFEEYQKLGIKIALGTDSITSNTCLDYQHEIRLFTQRYPQLDFFDLLPMLTTNALESIGVHDTGKLAIGYRADLIGFKTTNDCFDPKELILQPPITPANRACGSTY